MATPKELVQALYEAFARGDAETVLGALHPSVDWNEAEGGPLAVGNPYVGPQAVGGGVFGPLIRDLADFKVSPREFVAEGEDVVAFGRYTGTHRETGHALDAQFVHRWTVQDGKVAAFQQYTDTGQWTRVYGG
ncbi:MAG TPA: nuclear transport factor 2 family protein [Longimicrobiales bacterium]|nr:nuclear transport factor 2 family protein [Longimicrobiales bacterium]